jgi:hypothetical protein
MTDGGTPKVESWTEFQFRFSRAVAFFGTMWKLIDESMRQYDPPRTIQGRYQSGRIAVCTIQFGPSTGSFTIEDRAP